MIVKTKIFWSLMIVYVCACGLVSAETKAFHNDVVATVLEYKGVIETERTGDSVVVIGMLLTSSESLTLDVGEYVTLILRDSTITRIDGPSVISLVPSQNEVPGNVLARLTTALYDLFFQELSEGDEVFLGVRDVFGVHELPRRVPHLQYPPNDCNLIYNPVRFKWQPLEGVFSYTFSLFDSHRLILQQRTNGHEIEVEDLDTLFQPNETYLWVVDAHVGNDSLRSTQSMFTIMDKHSLSELKQRLQDITTVTTDQRLRHLLRMRLYHSTGLFTECYSEVLDMLSAFPGDNAAMIEQAELLTQMGFIEEANEVFMDITQRR